MSVIELFFIHIKNNKFYYSRPNLRYTIYLIFKNNMAFQIKSMLWNDFVPEHYTTRSPYMYLITKHEKWFLNNASVKNVL